MKQAVKLIILLAVIIVCIIVVRRTLNRHTFNTRLQEAHSLYEAADTPDEFREAKKAYTEMNEVASSREEKRMAEAGIASSDAWIAYLETMRRPDLEGYETTIKHMERAIELTDDPEGVWDGMLAQMRGLYEDALGPSLEEMRDRFARGKKMPFPQAMTDLEALYRWRERWKEQGRHQNDPAREALFDELRAYLLENHIRQFEASIASAREIADDDRSMEGLSQVARPLGLIGMVELHAPDKAEEFREKYADDFRRAERAQNILANM